MSASSPSHTTAPIDNNAGKPPINTKASENTTIPTTPADSSIAVTYRHAGSRADGLGPNFPPWEAHSQMRIVSTTLLAGTATCAWHGTTATFFCTRQNSTTTPFSDFRDIGDVSFGFEVAMADRGETMYDDRGNAKMFVGFDCQLDGHAMRGHMTWTGEMVVDGMDDDVVQSIE